MTIYQYLFGPVPSRRLGLSLGVDLTKHKTCSFDCVFCQLGRTAGQTIERKEYVPTAAVLDELNRWIEAGGQADYITLAGSGEPTLHVDFGRVLEFIGSHSQIPSALLTNGGLMCLPEVRKAAAKASVVKLSLSAWDDASYRWINRPHSSLNFEDLIHSYQIFRDMYDGQLWIEVFLIGGMNSVHAEIEKIANIAKEILPDRIHLNTAVRPPAYDFVALVSQDELKTLAQLFEPIAEVIETASIEQKSPPLQAQKDQIFNLLRRHPSTTEQISDVFGMHLNEVAKYIGELIASGDIISVRQNHMVYYRMHDTDKENEHAEG